MRQPMMVATTLSCGGSGGVRAAGCRMSSASGWWCQASQTHISTGTPRTLTPRPAAALLRPWRYRKCVCWSRARASARPRSRTRPASGHVKSAWFLRCHTGSGLPGWCRASPTSSPRKYSVSDLGYSVSDLQGLGTEISRLRRWTTGYTECSTNATETRQLLTTAITALVTP